MKSIYAAIILVLLSACTGSGIPDDIIGIDEMKIIIWDLTRAGEYKEISDNRKMNDTLYKKKDLIFLYQQVFSLHHIKKEVFYKSLDYYTVRPDLNKTLYDSVSAYANRQRVEMYIQRPR